MAYEFKKLSDVAVVETPTDTANVLIEEDGVIKKVAKDAVVPSNVALKSDIPDAIVNPTVAEVGQTIVVKAVDENGKPTEWECSDIVASWDDLEDKPFYDEMRKTVLIEETTMVYPDYGYGYNPDIDPNAEFIIVVNGVEYEAVYSPSEGFPGVRATDDSCPVAWYDGSFYYTSSDISDGTSFTVEIIQIGEYVEQIDNKYVNFPVISVNGKTGDVQLTADSLGAASEYSLNNKMDKMSPVGTGSFSMNRKAGTTIGGLSVAIGYNCTASNYYSYAEGQQSEASGNVSHAEGHSTTASGYCSHAEGYAARASGEYSHAEGYRTAARGNYSHAEGSDTVASVANTHAEGEYTIACTAAQHVQGRYNIEDVPENDLTKIGKYCHIVGNGNVSKRSNAHTLDWNGVPWYQGRPQFGGTAQDDGSQTVMANGDTEIILKSSTSGSTKKFKITVDDNGTITATEVTE